MRPTQIQLFINVGIDPLAHIRIQGIERLSAHTDSFGFSGLKENLVLNVEQILVNSWGEVSTRRYDGEQALIRCLHDYLQMIPPASNVSLPKLEVRCFCPTRAKAIAMRVEELFRDIAACYYSGTRPVNSRYILEIQRQFYVLQFENNHPEIKLVGDYALLLKYLDQPQSSYSPIVLDRHCLNNSLLEKIIQMAQPDQIQVFYQRREDSADIYILDERASLFSYSTPFYDEQSLLSPLDQFIQSTLFRRSSESDDFNNQNINEFNIDAFNLSDFEVEYYEIIESINSVQLTRRDIISEISGSNFFNIQAIADQDFNGKLIFNIYCDQQAFTGLELGKNLFSSVAQYVLGRRNSNERYPCYITDMDLSRGGNGYIASTTQTVHYLQQKHSLELALNSALKNI
jgi:adenylate cyclase class 1